MFKQQDEDFRIKEKSYPSSDLSKVLLEVQAGSKGNVYGLSQILYIT